MTLAVTASSDATGDQPGEAVLAAGSPLQLWDTYSVPNRMLRPEDITVRPTTIATIVALKREMSRAVWRPAPGRKMGFLVMANQDVIGMLFLSSPVINLGVRDAALGLDNDSVAKGVLLRHYADLSACVAAQPIGWYWNLGKLCALLATTLGDYFERRYGDDLRGIVTTSLYGRGAQYNRVYRFLGYTKGYGHEHISDEQYRAMLGWFRNHNIEAPGSRFGDGSNPRMRRIQKYRSLSGDTRATVFHGNARGVYYHEATPPEKRQEVIEAWYERWGRPRYERVRSETPPYLTGIEARV